MIWLRLSDVSASVKSSVVPERVSASEAPFPPFRPVPPHGGANRMVISGSRSGRLCPQPNHWQIGRVTVKRLFVFCLLFLPAWIYAEEIGHVDTAFQFLGPDHKIVVEAFDDPDVSGITCYLSRAKTGGLKGAVGLAEDPARFSVACRQVGAVRFGKSLPLNEEVFKQGASVFFKHVRVVRMVDVKRNALIYLTYSDRLIEGHPDNAITAVAQLDKAIPVEDD